MDTPSDEGFVVDCAGAEYAAHVKSQHVSTGGEAPPSDARWWVLLDGKERRSPYLYDPAETRDSVTRKLCEWIRAGAEHAVDD